MVRRWFRGMVRQHVETNSVRYRGGGKFTNGSSSLAWGLQTAFTENTAFSRGTIYADSSFVVCNCEGTTFSNNYAFKHGGAIKAERSSSISSDGKTFFTSNEALEDGGPVYLTDYSTGSWKGVTKFINNSASNGVWVMPISSANVSWNSEIVSTNTSAAYLLSLIHI